MLKVKKYIPRNPALYAPEYPSEAMNIFYDHIDPRRRQEMADSRMIQEDHRQVANLPREFIHQEYNQNRFNRFKTQANPQPWIDDEIEPF